MSPAQSATAICLLVLLATVKSGDLEGDFVVERYDNGDVVHWSGITNCDDINGYAPSSGNCNGAVVMPVKPACCCNFLHSFTTLTGKCEPLYDERSGGGRYRFDRSGMTSDTSVSTMKPHCRKYDGHKNCTLVSEINNDLLSVAYNISHYDLGACEINGIYILHDCKLRNLPLGLPTLKQHEDEKYYIHFDNVADDKLELHGEMIQIDINCSNTYGGGKLWFKVRGRSNLDKEKNFIGGVYPAYEPVNHFNYSLCSDPSPNHYDIPVPVLISLTVVVIIGAPLLLTLIAKYRQRRRNHNEEECQRLLQGGPATPGPQGDQGLAMTDGQPVESATGPPPDQVKTPAQATVSSSFSTSSTSSKSSSDIKLLQASQAPFANV